MSPLGWAKGNILYDKYNKVPEQGSLIEALFILIFNLRQQSVYYSALLHASSALSQKAENIKELDNSLRLALFPYQKDNEVRYREKAMAFMDRKFSGPIKITRKRRNK